jgi:predicted RecB family endonuclease
MQFPRKIRRLCAAVLTMACLHNALAADEESVREMAEASQHMLNEMVSQVTSLRAMAEAKTFDGVTKTLEKQVANGPPKRTPPKSTGPASRRSNARCRWRASRMPRPPLPRRCRRPTRRPGSTSTRG